MNEQIISYSIFPILFHIGKIPIYSHDFFSFIALIFGGLVYFYYARKQKIKNERMIIVIFSALLGGIIGSRLPIILAYLPEILYSKESLYFILSGKTIVGGLIGGTVAVWLAKKYFKIFGRFGNAIAPAVALGIAIGRIGCFLGSDAVGTITTVSWGVNFGDNLLRHPTQLYESLFCLLLFGYYVFRLWKNKKNQDGVLFTHFIVSYFIFRFFVEYIRIEPKIFLGMSRYQYAALLVLLYQGGKYYYQKHVSIS